MQLTQLLAKQHPLAFRNSQSITITNCLNNLSTQSGCQQGIALAIVYAMKGLLSLRREDNFGVTRN